MRYALSLLVLLSIAACGRDPAVSASTGATNTAASNRSPAAEETVAAVQQSPGKATVTLRFLLESAPAVGSPTRVRLDFSAADPVAQLALRTEGVGLKVDAAGAAAMLALPEAGKTVSHAVSVTPQAPGFSELIVRALPPGDGATEIVYVIPVMADAAAAAAK